MCFIISILLCGCKEKGGLISVFDGIPESTYITEFKTSIENKKPIAIAFTAEWCPHCRNYKPIFNEVKNTLSNDCTFINIDVDDSNGSPVSGRFMVGGIPTTAFVRADGSVFKVEVGEIEKEQLIKIVGDLVKSKKRGKGEPIAPFPIEPIEVKAPPEKETKDEKPQDIIKQESEEEIKDKVEEVKDETKKEEPEVKEEGKSKNPVQESAPEDKKDNADVDNETDTEDTEEGGD